MKGRKKSIRKAYLAVVLVIGCIQPIDLLAQLQGSYGSTMNGKAGLLFEFGEDSTFLYHFKNEKGEKKGKGTFFIGEDTLHFIFQSYLDSGSRDCSFLRVEKDSLEKAGDSVRLTFEVLDCESQLPLPLVNIWERSPKGKEFELGLTNDSGRLTTSFRRIDRSAKLFFRKKDYHEQSISLRLDQNTHFDLGLLSSRLVYIDEGVHWQYKVIQASKKHYQLQPLSKSIPELTDLYRGNKLKKINRMEYRDYKRSVNRGRP